MRARRIALFGFMSAMAFVFACSDDSFSYAHIDNVQGDPNTAISTVEIIVPAGEAAVARVQLYSHENHLMAGQVVSADPSLLEIRPTEDDSTYAFLGIREGSTVVRLLVGGNEVKQIPTLVSGQSP